LVHRRGLRSGRGCPCEQFDRCRIVSPVGDEVDLAVVVVDLLDPDD
jgi:hypothetical protein